MILRGLQIKRKKCGYSCERELVTNNLECLSDSGDLCREYYFRVIPRCL
jgi:hypothetical protein